MSRFLWSCAALLTVFVAVESLICYTCDVKVLGSCLIDTRVNCTNGEDRCYRGVAKFSEGILDYHAGGCLRQSDCVNSTGQILNLNYTITRTCCDKDLCNGATSAHLPLSAALGAALLALWSQWVL